MMQDAIYYAGGYLTLPEGFESYDEFRRFVDASALPVSIRTHVLRERQNIPLWTVEKGICMAPYFIDGYYENPVTVTISDPSLLYPTRIELLSQEDYNKRLRELILSYCPGCTRYKPLTNRVQSLNGHFEEISLDGFCSFRCETKPSPRVLRENLLWMRGSLRHFPDTLRSPEEIARWAKQYAYLKLKNILLHDEDECFSVEASADGGAFDRMIASIWAENLTMACRGKCRVSMRESGDLSEEELQKLLSPEEEEKLRKACKKYGVSLLQLRYPADRWEEVFLVLAALEEQDWLAIVRNCEGQGRCYCLALDTANALKQLRYHAPFLQALGASVTVAGQYGTKSYQISFDMREL